jgi:hypothetical protein
MKEAYLKVLGLDQKSLEEKKMGRPSWVPESIKDDKVSDFMGALSAAHKEGYEEFEFGNKKFKMTIGKKDAEKKDVKEDASNDKSDDGEGMDKVDAKAVKKKFGDRKDKDIDNDGDEDESDEYLHNRRKAISKNVAEGVTEGSFGSGYGSVFTLYVNTGEKPPTKTKTKKFKREDDAVAWAEDYADRYDQYPNLKMEIKDENGGVVWELEESQGVAEGGVGGGKVVRDTEKPPFDPPYSTRKIATPGKSGYGPSAAKHLAKQGMKKTYEDIEIEEFAQDLLENGFSQDEVDSIIAGLDEKKHVGTDGPEPAEAEEMGDTLSDGELDFIDMHEVEIVDVTPEDPKHHEATKKATPPTTKGIGTAEVDGQKIVAAKPEVAVKSQATQPK